MRPFDCHVTTNSNKMKGLSLQKKIMDSSSIYPTYSNRYIKGSHYISQKNRRIPVLKASLTLEAAIAFPIFIIVLAQLLSVFIIYYEYSKQLVTLHQNAKLLGVAGYALQDNGIDMNLFQVNKSTDDIVDLFVIKDLTPDIMLTQQNIVVCVRGRVRAWTGYDNTNETEHDVYVYITEYGEVYHKSRNCSHLQLSIQKITYEELTSRRNSEGSYYSQCEYCHPETNSVNGYLFITEDGERFHNSLDCIGLTRTIRMIPLSQAGQYSPCSQCCK